MRKPLHAVFIAAAIAFSEIPATAMPVGPPSAFGVATGKNVARVHSRGWLYRDWVVRPPRYTYLPWWWRRYEIPAYSWNVYTVPYGYYYVSPHYGW